MLLKSARSAQYSQLASFRFTAADTMANTAGVVAALKASGTFEPIPLPIGAIVIGGEVVVNTASNESGAAHTIALGDATNPTRFLAATSIKAAGRTPIVPTGFVGTGENLRITLAASNGDATAGDVSIRLDYVIDGRVHEVVIV